MRILRALIVAAAIAVGFSSLVLWTRRHSKEQVHESVVKTEQEQGNKPKELQKMVSPIEPLLEGVGDYLWISRWAAKGAQTETVQVDHSVSRLVISATGEPTAATLEVVDPDGHPAKPTKSQKLRVIHLVDGTVIAVDDPTPGAWRITVQGQGQLSLWVRGASQAGFDSFRVNDAVSGALVDPEAGEAVNPEQHLKITTRLSAQQALAPKFSMIALDGNTLEPPITVEHVESESMGSEKRRRNVYHLNVIAPFSEFRILVRGHDNKSASYQRITPLTFKIKTR